MPFICQPPTTAFFTPVASPATRLAVAERQVVDEAADEPMVDVEVGQAVVALGIVVVQEPLPAVEPGRADAGRRRLGVGALGPRVGEGQQRRPRPRCSSLVLNALKFDRPPQSLSM